MKATYKFESAINDFRSNLMSYALMLTSSRPAADKLVDETSARALAVGADEATRDGDLKGMLFSIMRDIYNANYRGTSTPHLTLEARATAAYHIEVPTSRGIAAIRGIKHVDELSDAVSRLQPRSRRVFSMYSTGYTISEIRRSLGLTRLAVISSLISAYVTIF